MKKFLGKTARKIKDAAEEAFQHEEDFSDDESLPDSRVMKVRYLGIVREGLPYYRILKIDKDFGSWTYSLDLRSGVATPPPLSFSKRKKKEKEEKKGKI